MALTTGQLLSGAGAVSRGMDVAEERQRIARQNQLAIEAQNRADEARRQIAQAQAGLQVPNVPQFAGMTGGQQFQRPGVVTPQPQPQAQPPAAQAYPVNVNVPEERPIPEFTPATQRPPSAAIGPATYPGFQTPMTQAERDRIALLKPITAAADVIQAPVAAGLNVGMAGFEGVLNVGGRLVNAVTGEEVLPTDFQGPRFGMTPFYDRYVREPEAAAAGVQEPAAPAETETPTAPAAGVQEPAAPAETETPTAPAAPQEPDVTTPQGSQPRSVRNNNPGNLIFNDYTRSLGAVGQDEDGFAIFENPQAGQQAAVANLQNYGQRGINTVSGIINRWAPPNAPGNSAESTNNYIAYVAGKLGVDPNTPLDMNNQQVLGAVAQYISEFESGHTSPLKGTTPGQTADRVAQATSSPMAAASGVMYGPSEVSGMQNPAMQSALMMRQILAEQYQIYANVGMPDAANEALAQIAGIDLGLFKAQADLGVQELALTGDASRAMSVLSQFTGTPTQALARGDGTYDIYANGQLSQTGVPVNSLAELVRTTVDAQYRQQKAELASDIAVAETEAAGRIREETIKQLGKLRDTMARGQFDVLVEEAKKDGKLQVDTANAVAYYREGGRMYVITPNAVQEIAGVEQVGPVARPINLP